MRGVADHVLHVREGDHGDDPSTTASGRPSSLSELSPGLKHGFSISASLASRGGRARARNCEAGNHSRIIIYRDVEQDLYI